MTDPRASDEDLTAKARIRNAALDLYAERGEDRVSMRAVAAAAGASWHIDWVPELLTSEPTELAQWTPDYTPPPAKRFARPLAPTDAVPESVATAAAEVFAAAGEQWRTRRADK